MSIYSTRVVATGGRDGSIRSEDGHLDLSLTLPTALGGKGTGTNPEQLFAGGYAACFGNAVIHVTRKTAKIQDDAVVVTADVSLNPNGEGGFALGVALSVTIKGVEQAAAEEIVAAAHAVCPYSNAIRGNVDVAITVLTT